MKRRQWQSAKVATWLSIVLILVLALSYYAGRESSRREKVAFDFMGPGYYIRCANDKDFSCDDGMVDFVSHTTLEWWRRGNVVAVAIMPGRDTCTIEKLRDLFDLLDKHQGVKELFVTHACFNEQQAFFKNLPSRVTLKLVDESQSDEGRGE